MITARDQQEAARLGLVDIGEQAGIGFLIEQFVRALRRAEPVAQHTRRAVVVIECDIDESAGIGGPDHLAGGIGDRIRQVLAGVEIAHADQEQFRAGLVGAPGEEAMVGAVLGIAEIEELLALGEGVGIEHDLLPPGLATLVRARFAADQRVFAAAPVAAVIQEWPVRLRRLAVILLDAPAHLFDQFALEYLRRRHQRVAPGVLRLDMLADLGGQGVGIAQHVAPVLGAQPGIVVVQDDAVDGTALRADRGNRR